jgi:hypothetical protein
VRQEATSNHGEVGWMPLIFVDNHNLGTAGRHPHRITHTHSHTHPPKRPVARSAAPFCVSKQWQGTGVTSASLRALELRGLGGLIGPSRPIQCPSQTKKPAAKRSREQKGS